MKYRKPVIEAIIKEIDLRVDYLNKDIEFDTLYFGGGTPSVLSEGELSSIIEKLDQTFNLSKVKETTLETNPDDIDQDKLRTWNTLGINRLSIGIQSFDDEILLFLNRSHNAEKAERAVKLSQDNDFDNLSIDLIYGIPNQSIFSWQKTVDKAIDLAPPHISSYCLTIEPNTVFGRWQNKGSLKEKPEQKIIDEYEILTDRLFSNGYEQYEVSNFCKPGMESKHNSSYWKQEPYLGIGPSAHSYDGKSRQFNVSNNSKYIKALNQDLLIFEKEQLSPEQNVEEYVLTSLRTIWGTDLNYLLNSFDLEINPGFYNWLNEFESMGYLLLENDHISLTSKGMLMADGITLKMLEHISVENEHSESDINPK